nr:MAG TPA: hypothetical protein [Caudoviricetes sp.]
MIKEIWEDLQKQANYAVASKNKELMYEAYGAAKMARKMCAISAEQMRELNTKLVRNGINNPKTWNAEREKSSCGRYRGFGMRPAAAAD